MVLVLFCFGFFGYYECMKDLRATQDYIKSIATLLMKSTDDVVKLKVVSEKLTVSHSAVCDMVKKLEKEGYVKNHSYKGVELTDKGWGLGRRLIRHHRLWEVFLHQTLQVPWDEVHDEAEHLEHAASDTLMNRIDEVLGFPEVDPHGNPIPTADGKVVFNENEKVLFDIPINKSHSIHRFESLDPAYLNYLSQHGFCIGAEIRVVERFDFDQSIICELNGHKIQFSLTIAKQIFVS